MPVALHTRSANCFRFDFKSQRVAVEPIATSCILWVLEPIDVINQIVCQCVVTIFGISLHREFFVRLDSIGTVKLTIQKSITRNFTNELMTHYGLQQ